jgi:predicted Zn-dependent peptidase
VPILGTSDTIRQITDKTLHDCHRAFYSPANMLLCVVGDVDPDAVVSIADKVLGTAPRSAGEKKNDWDEPMTVVTPLVKRNMEIAMPAFQLGFKCEPLGKGEEAIRQEIVGDLAAEALFGESSQLYLELYEEGIIDSSFGGGFETIDGCAMLMCSGDSDEPAAVRTAILEQAAKIAAEGIDETAFLRMEGDYVVPPCRISRRYHRRSLRAVRRGETLSQSA